MKVVEISETRILFSVHFSHKLKKSERPLQNFYCQITMLKCQIRGTVTSFTCKITQDGRSMRQNLMRVLSYHLRLALSCSCFAAAFPHNSKTLLCTENCALLGHYAASSGNFLPTFRDNISVQSSGFNLRMGCPETLARNYHYSLPNSPEDRSSQLLRGGSLKSRIVMHLSCVPRMLHDHPPNAILLYFFTQLIFVQSVQ